MRTLKAITIYIAVIMIGIFVGMILNGIIVNSDDLSTKDFWQTVGSVSAGFGTLAILIFGWIRTNDWLSQVKLDHQITLITSNCREFIKAIDDLGSYMSTAKTEIIATKECDGLQREDDFVLSGLFNSAHSSLDILHAIYSDQPRMNKDMLALKTFLIELREQTKAPPNFSFNKDTYSQLALQAKVMVNRIIKDQVKN